MLLSAPLAAAPKRVPAVADSIQLTVLADPDVNSARSLAGGFKQSPDGRRFFVVTRQGNLETGQNDYVLHLYDAQSVRRSMTQSELPRATALAHFSSSSNRPAIARARWLSDSRTIALVAENPGEAAQVYSIDSQTGRIQQLTHHPTPVVDFDLNTTAQRFVYLAEMPPDWSARVAHGYEVGTSTLYEVMGKGRYSLYTPVAPYIGAKDKVAALRVDMAPYKLVTESFGMWLSPGGRWAIVMGHATNVPASWWEEYAPVRANAYLKGVNAPGMDGFTSDHPSIFMQYVLVDMRTGRSRPILDAPSGLVFGGDLGVHWSADDASVILANTFLPLQAASAAEQARNRATPAVVQVDIASGKVNYIAGIVPSGAVQAPRGYSSSVFNGRNQLQIAWKSAQGASRSSYCKSADVWQACEASKAALAQSLSLSVTQGLNQPPEITATDSASGRSKVITDFNPQLRALDLGNAEVLHWTDGTGREWTGGLLKPMNATPARRYPLVILTHGFDPAEFWMDGPGGATSGYAARALAGRGMMVLQIDDTKGVSGFRDELQTQARGYQSAIAKLDELGLIDTTRVGVHGWSRTGYYVQHAVVFLPSLFAAASVADPSALGAWTYANFFGFAYPGMLEYERMLDTPLWGGDSARTWAERDPTFHLDQVRTPLRIEMYQYGLGWWDMYAMLRRQQRAVEFLSFPDGGHNLVKPWERLTSQEGTVDWHDFWLNGHEDPSPSKAEQYVRWRKLRVAHEAALMPLHGTQLQSTRATTPPCTDAPEFGRRQERSTLRPRPATSPPACAGPASLP